MEEIYKHLTTQERAVSMTMRDDACSIRSIAKSPFRSPGTISREIKRAACTGVLRRHARRLLPRCLPKLHAMRGHSDAGSDTVIWTRVDALSTAEAGSVRTKNVHPQRAKLPEPA